MIPNWDGYSNTALVVSGGSSHHVTIPWHKCGNWEFTTLTKSCWHEDFTYEVWCSNHGFLSTLLEVNWLFAFFNFTPVGGILYF
jgi:hypothetical protein